MLFYVKIKVYILLFNSIYAKVSFKKMVKIVLKSTNRHCEHCFLVCEIATPLSSLAMTGKILVLIIPTVIASIVFLCVAISGNILPPITPRL